VRFGESGVDLQRPAIARHRAIECPRSLRAAPRFCCALRQTRVDLQRPAIAPPLRRQVARGFQGIAQITVRPGIIGRSSVALFKAGKASLPCTEARPQNLPDEPGIGDRSSNKRARYPVPRAPGIEQGDQLVNLSGVGRCALYQIFRHGQIQSRYESAFSRTVHLLMQQWRVLHEGAAAPPKSDFFAERWTSAIGRASTEETPESVLTNRPT